MHHRKVARRVLSALCVSFGFLLALAFSGSARADTCPTGALAPQPIRLAAATRRSSSPIW